MPQHSLVLESKFGRIKLVPPAMCDDEDVALCRTDPATRRYLGFLPLTMTSEEVRIRRETRAEDPRLLDMYIYHIQEDGSTRFAGLSGYFGIDEQHRSCEAGIILIPDFHGQDLTTETFYVLLKHIFEERKLHRTTFETATDNVAMRGWLEKVAQARLEADRKECWQGIDGTFSDAKGYAILDWEWKDRIKPRLEARLEKRFGKIGRNISVCIEGRRLQLD